MSPGIPFSLEVSTTFLPTLCCINLLCNSQICSDPPTEEVVPAWNHFLFCKKTPKPHKKHPRIFPNNLNLAVAMLYKQNSCHFNTVRKLSELVVRHGGGVWRSSSTLVVCFHVRVHYMRVRYSTVKIDLWLHLVLCCRNIKLQIKETVEGRKSPGRYTRVVSLPLSHTHTKGYVLYFLEIRYVAL